MATELWFVTHFSSSSCIICCHPLAHHSLSLAPPSLPPHLQVSVIRRATVPPDAPPLSPVLEACVLSQLRSDRVSDIWRGLMVARVTNVAYVAAEQAARMLACFNYRGERIVSNCGALL
jgi:hypothetical protein